MSGYNVSLGAFTTLDGVGVSLYLHGCVISKLISVSALYCSRFRHFSSGGTIPLDDMRLALDELETEVRAELDRRCRELGHVVPGLVVDETP